AVVRKCAVSQCPSGQSRSSETWALRTQRPRWASQYIAELAAILADASFPGSVQGRPCTSRAAEQRSRTAPWIAHARGAVLAGGRGVQRRVPSIGSCRTPPSGTNDAASTRSARCAVCGGSGSLRKPGLSQALREPLTVFRSAQGYEILKIGEAHGGIDLQDAHHRLLRFGDPSC